jgi:hypothetical protein
MSLERANKLIFIAGNKGCMQPRNPEHAVVIGMIEEAD